MKPETNTNDHGGVRTCTGWLQTQARTRTGPSSTSNTPCRKDELHHTKHISEHCSGGRWCRISTDTAKPVTSSADVERKNGSCKCRPNDRKPTHRHFVCLNRTRSTHMRLRKHSPAHRPPRATCQMGRTQYNTVTQAHSYTVPLPPRYPRRA